MICMQQVPIEPHARGVCSELWYQMACVLRASAFCTQPACSRFPVGVTYLSHTKSELAGSHRLMSRPDTCLGIRTHLSICGCMEDFIFRLMYVQLYLYLDLWRQILKMCRYVDALCLLPFICTLKHTHTHTHTQREGVQILIHLYLTSLKHPL